MFGRDEKCQNCENRISILTQCVNDLSKHDSKSERTLEAWMKTIRQQHKKATSCGQLKLELKKKQLLILTLNSLEVPHVVNFLGVKLELVCCVEKLNQSSMRTLFKNRNQFYTAERN